MLNPTVTPVPGKPNLLLGTYDLADVGYRVEEFFVSGTATSFAGPTETAEYTTRIAALMPTDPGRFSGTVVVEWLNVSGGIDAPAVWFMAHREVIRAGHGYVVVSAQRVGVEGGDSLGMDLSLKTQNAERYSALHHPGDAFSFDMYSHAGRLVRQRSSVLLGGAEPKMVLAVGESQSAAFLTTYINAVDRSAAVYDGFLVHSRFGGAASLDGGSFLGESDEPVPFIRELRVPVLTVITETDLVGKVRSGYHAARQPDAELLRTWEIPGTAHADNYTNKVGFVDSGLAPLDALVAGYAPTNSLMGKDLPYFINFGPQHHYVLQAALARLVEWVAGGGAPPSAPPLDLSDDAEPRLLCDDQGIATGGVRTPWVDIPVAWTSGLADAEDVMGLLFGCGEPFSAEKLAALYPDGADEYLRRFGASLDTAIGAGFLLAADREEILALAAAVYARQAG